MIHCIYCPRLKEKNIRFPFCDSSWWFFNEFTFFCHALPSKEWTHLLTSATWEVLFFPLYSTIWRIQMLLDSTLVFLEVRSKEGNIFEDRCIRPVLFTHFWCQFLWILCSNWTKIPVQSSTCVGVTSRLWWQKKNDFFSICSDSIATVEWYCDCLCSPCLWCFVGYGLWFKEYTRLLSVSRFFFIYSSVRVMSFRYICSDRLSRRRRPKGNRSDIKMDSWIKDPFSEILSFVWLLKESM
jgi:hypothetical protein